MKHFKLKEFLKSSTATRLKIDNTPSKEAICNLEALVENILDPLREAYGKPIIITSGYRCPKLNTAVKGAKTSQHALGQAADIKSALNSIEENKKLFNLIISLKLPFDQLINEHNFSWVHVSFSPRHRKQILNIK